MNNEKKVEVSVVMPCLNEEETIGKCLKKAFEAFKRLNLNGEVVVADNGSTDRSVEIAKQFGAKVVHQQLRGYGNALRAGIEAANGQYVIMGDADDSYDFGDIEKFVDQLREGQDLVMGCRLPSGGGKIMPGAMPWKHRFIGNPVLSKIGKIFFSSTITDFHCGLRGFSKAAYNEMRLNTTGMEFASEMVIKATLSKKKISEVPITLYKDGRSRPPHLRSWRDGWRHLRFMLLYSPRWLFVYPGLILLTVGLITMMTLMQGPLALRHVSLDTNTMMMGALAVILGLQIFGFGITARIFSMIEGFLPSDATLERLFKYITLEVGLAIGAILTFIGLGIVITVFIWWMNVDFGMLPRATVLRIIIPGVTAIAIGVQIIFSSFFLSFIGLKRV